MRVILKGFNHPDAVEFLIDNLDSKKIHIREIAAQSLGAMDFEKFKEPMKWYAIVESSLKDAYDAEKEEWLKDDLKEIIDNLKIPSVENK